MISKELPALSFTEDFRRDWEKFRRRVRKLGRDIPDCVEAYDCPAFLWLASPESKRALYFTKIAAFRRYAEDFSWQRPPFAAIGHSGLPGSKSLASIVRLARLVKCPLFFVGDLDPGDLTIYAALRCGSSDLAPSKRHGLPIRYLGIGGNPFRKLRSRTPRSSWIQMDDAERNHFELIQRVYPNLETMIGSYELTQLREGRKLEIEGLVSGQQNRLTDLIRLLDTT